MLKASKEIKSEGVQLYLIGSDYSELPQPPIVNGQNPTYLIQNSRSAKPLQLCQTELLNESNRIQGENKN